jgi:hypothetical protein
MERQSAGASGARRILLQTQVDHFDLETLDSALTVAVRDRLDIYPAETADEPGQVE